MSETRARASRFARWSGSLERNGLSGRRAPPSPIAGDAPGGVAGGRGGAGRAAGAEGTNGAADGPVVEVTGRGGGTDAAGGAPAVNGGSGGGGVNSGSPLVGDGGVTVAVTGPRLSDSSRVGRGAGISLARGGAGGGGGAGRWIGGAAGV